MFTVAKSKQIYYLNNVDISKKDSLKILDVFQMTDWLKLVNTVSKTEQNIIISAENGGFMSFPHIKSSANKQTI